MFRDIVYREYDNQWQVCVVIRVFCVFNNLDEIVWREIVSRVRRMLRLENITYMSKHLSNIKPFDIESLIKILLW